MQVLATAGHVDHGKSTLVRALTGMEPDRWAEERRRGLTIDLGFAWTSLPSGEVAFVDVPGHARFVPNMLAGVGPVPAVLFVVAADQGWQAQSEEHLAAVEALGVRHAVVAVSRCDLADPTATSTAVRDRLAGGPFDGAPVLPVCAPTGSGLAALRAALNRVLGRLPAPDPSAPPRLWVDRVFTVRGAGTVVTGTLRSGSLRLHDTLQVAVGGRHVRVRGLQMLQRPVGEATAVARVAVNLRGVDVAQLSRGQVLTAPGRWSAVSEFDARIPGDPDLPAGDLVLHVGSAAVPTRVRRLGPGAVRVRLAVPLPLWVGDRALLRDPGRHRVVTGLVVLDVRPPALHRRGAAAARAGQLLRLPVPPELGEEVIRRGAVPVEDLLSMGHLAPSSPPPGTRRTAGWLVAERTWSAWRVALVSVVHAAARDRPLSAGLTAAAARRLVGVGDPRLFDALVADTGDVEETAGRLRPRSTRSRLPDDVQQAVTSLCQLLHDRPFAAAAATELASLGLDRPRLAAAVRAGRLTHLGGGVYLLPDAEVEAVRRLAGLRQPFTVSDARRALHSTRRVVVPLLERLDRDGWTRREDTLRRRLVRTPVQAGQPDRSA